MEEMDNRSASFPLRIKEGRKDETHTQKDEHLLEHNQKA
jgi:hypothetical protein